MPDSRVAAGQSTAFVGTIHGFSQSGHGVIGMTTYSAKTGEVQHGWFVVDAQNKVLGKLASQIASRLRGKHKPEYTPHVDTGDFIVVVNVTKLRVTGRKAEDKIYYRHSGQPGGLKQETFGKLHAAKPERVLKMAVKGMLPKGPLGYAMLRKLKLYGGATHPHSAQQPKTLEI
jgi:large subunit ribosomal protein L13